jgi:hypothetical protein
MEPENDWEVVRNERGWDLRDAGMGLFRATLLFGVGIAVLAMLVAPVLEQRRQEWANGAVDPMNVGSIGPDNTYTIRKSVLQPSPDSICIIRADGTRHGDC